MLTRQEAHETIAVYIKAWQSQDPDLIVSIFTPDATYHERVLQEPIPDREAIRRYWVDKVVQSQANITCELRNLYLDGDTVIAEWDADFDDLAQGVRKHMREIAVLTFEGRLISSLREYWASEVIPGRLVRRAEPSTARHAARAGTVTGGAAAGPGARQEG
jgi:ketosteroid isomerase-like protein